MLQKSAIKAAKLSPGETLAFALLNEFHTKHPDKFAAVLSKHEHSFTGNQMLDIIQVDKLARDRGRWFTEDFESALNDAKYFSLGDLFDKTKTGLGNVLSSNAAGTAAGLAANIFAPGTGGLASNVVGGLGAALGGGSHQGSGGQEAPDPPSPTSPPELQASASDLSGIWTGTYWNKTYNSFVPVVITGKTIQGHPLAATMNYTYDNASTIRVPQLNVTGSISGDGKTISFSNGGTWIKLSNEQGVNPQAVTQAVNQAFSPKSPNTPNLDDRDPAKNLDKEMDKDDDSSDDKILGIKKKYFWYVATPVILLVVSLIVWLILRARKKKKLAEQKKVG